MPYALYCELQYLFKILMEDEKDILEITLVSVRGNVCLVSCWVLGWGIVVQFACLVRKRSAVGIPPIHVLIASNLHYINYFEIYVSQAIVALW